MNISDDTPDRYLSTLEYEQLVEAAETYRQRLVVRLAGEAGLRASEITRVCPSDCRETEGFRGEFLRVRENNGGTRETYLNPSLSSEFERYVKSNSVPEDSAVVGLSVRSIQTIVGEVAEAAAEITGSEELRDTTPKGLRSRFAFWLLSEKDVDPVAVKEAGGWKSLDTVGRYADGAGVDELAASLEGDSTEGSGGDNFADATEAVVESEGREETARSVCEALSETYTFCWMEGVGIGGASSLDAWSGASADVVESARSRLPDSIEEPVLVQKEAGTDASVLGVPVLYAGTRYGLLGAGNDEGFDADDYDRLEILGKQVGHSLAADRRRKTLSADSVIEIELRVTDPDDFLVSLSEKFGCEFKLRSVVSSSESVDLLHVALDGCDHAEVLEHADEIEGIDSSRLVENRGTSSVVEFAVSDASAVRLLGGYGSKVTDAVFENGEGKIVADCAYGTDLQTAVEGVKTRFSGTELIGKRELDRSTRTTESFVEDVTRKLTDRQEEALRAAYFGGYFDWPRGSTAEEIADSMDVSSPTLHNHLRKGQREILTVLFED